MAGRLTIAAVTAVLKDILDTGFKSYSTETGISNADITLYSPDRITPSNDEHNQINLFLYRVAPHAQLANLGVNTESGSIKHATLTAKNQSSISLELHYLLTAYSSQDYHAEILLGTAIYLLQSKPILEAKYCRETLVRLKKQSANALSPGGMALMSSKTAPIVQEIKIRPQFLNMEDMSKLWSSLQARYRPSITYMVSTVTID